jgi:hypothetical protein
LEERGGQEVTSINNYPATVIKRCREHILLDRKKINSPTNHYINMTEPQNPMHIGTGRPIRCCSNIILRTKQAKRPVNTITEFDKEFYARFDNYTSYAGCVACVTLLEQPKPFGRQIIKIACEHSKGNETRVHYVCPLTMELSSEHVCIALSVRPRGLNARWLA